MAVLVVAEHDNKTIKKATLNAVAAAQKLGGDIHVLVAGHGRGRGGQGRRRRSRASRKCCTPTRRTSASSWPRTSLP